MPAAGLIAQDVVTRYLADMRTPAPAPAVPARRPSSPPYAFGPALCPAVDEGRDHLFGSPTAPVTLLMYGDYASPLSRHAYHVAREVRATAGAWLVRICWRHFPAGGGSRNGIASDAGRAAEAAEAAGAQGRFWEMHALVLERLAGRPGTHSDGDLVGLALAAGLDTAAFGRDLLGRRHADEVRAHFEGGLASRVVQVPTFFLDGRRYDGGWGINELCHAVLDRAEVLNREGVAA